MNARQTILSDFISKHPYAVAQFLESASSEDVAVFFQTISLQNRIKLFSVMEMKKGAAILKLLPYKSVKELLENTDTVIVASILKHLDSTSIDKITASLSEKKKNDVRQQLSFLPNTVAAKMQNAIVVTKPMLIKDVLELVRRTQQEEVIFLYVVDVEGVFQGVVKLKDIVLADETDTIEHLSVENIPGFLSDTPINSIVNHPVWTQFPEVPIVNSSGILLGSLSHRNTFQISEEGKRNPNLEIAETGNALGELYRIGLLGLIQGGGK